MTPFSRKDPLMTVSDEQKMTETNSSLIRYTIGQSSLGSVLIAVNENGLCRIAFDESEAELRALYRDATIREDADGLRHIADCVVQEVDNPDTDQGSDLSLDIQGTEFQKAVWAALRSIPAGETRSYAELATLAGRPSAVRAAGSACARNAFAVLVPCHRVVRSDGDLGGYAWGLDRKRRLLERELAV
jgi:AraC family transcriptional regulator, regulatory protein of adaptative response / methylated-DNA-[protein]-cysteine methyltransferase